MSQAIRIGIDVGSTTTKAVAIAPSGEILRRVLESGEPRVRDQAERMLTGLRDEFGCEVPVVATGYGRKLVPDVTRRVTEISCHARGAFHLIKQHGALIDVGGQDTKVIRLGPGGKVADFAMNDKCAAGTGRFLEVILPRLEVAWDELAERFDADCEPVRISSTCTVFAESEVISMLANGETVDGIVKGLHVALSGRVGALAARLTTGVSAVFLSGGVANNAAMVSALSRTLGKPIHVVPDPQYVGALGAALSA